MSSSAKRKKRARYDNIWNKGKRPRLRTRTRQDSGRDSNRQAHGYSIPARHDIEEDALSSDLLQTDDHPGCSQEQGH